MFGRWGAAVVCALAIGVVAAPVAQAEKGGGLKAKITRNKQGIPTIEADSYKDLGFGYGYAFASDDICVIADTYLTGNAERSKWFGPDAKSPEGFTQSRLRPVLPAPQGSGHDQGGLLPQASGRARARGQAGDQGIRRRLQPLSEEDRGRKHPRSDLRRPALGAPDHQDGRLPALLRADRVRERRRRDRWHSRGAAAGGRGRSATTTPTRRRPKRSARRRALRQPTSPTRSTCRRTPARTAGGSARTPPSPAAASCSPTRTSRGRGRGASISRTW